MGFPFDGQAVPIHLLDVFFFHISTHASERPRRGSKLAITSGHTALLPCSLHDCRPVVTRHVSECLVFLLQLKAPHISFAFIQSNFPFWFWQHMDQIWGSLMTGNTLVGILLLLFLVSRGN